MWAAYSAQQRPRLIWFSIHMALFRLRWHRDGKSADARICTGGQRGRREGALFAPSDPRRLATTRPRLCRRALWRFSPCSSGQIAIHHWCGIPDGLMHGLTTAPAGVPGPAGQPTATRVLHGHAGVLIPGETKQRPPALKPASWPAAVPSTAWLEASSPPTHILVQDTKTVLLPTPSAIIGPLIAKVELHHYSTAAPTELRLPPRMEAGRGNRSVPEYAVSHQARA